MSIESLQDLYVNCLKDAYSAEQQIIKALPKVIDAAARPELKSALSEHLEQTKTHVERLDRILESMQEDGKGKKCRGMEGILKEANELLSEEAPEEVRDAGIIDCAQHVEHYEIAAYGTLREFARQLKHEEAVRLLEQTLQEEGAADKALTGIAESGVNRDALHSAAAESSTAM